MITRPLAVIGAAVLVVVLLVGSVMTAFYVGRWRGGVDARTPHGQAPAAPDTLTAAETDDRLPQPERTLIEHVTHTQVQPVVVEIGQSALTDSLVAAYVAAALAARDSIPDNDPEPLYPTVTVNTDKKALLTLGLLRSDGVWETDSLNCKHPCIAGAVGTTVYGKSARQLPDWLPTGLVCAALGGGTYAIGRAAAWDKAALAGLGVGGGCVVARWPR